MNRWDEGAIEYTDVDAVKRALVGRTVTSVVDEGEQWERVLSFVLDDGTVLKAHATDGGCGCDNGCFSVKNPDRVEGASILNVELEERASADVDWPAKPQQVVEPGSVTDGEAVIRLFVYTELGKQILVESEGGDNGYYGWGFWLSVHTPEVAS